MYELIVFIWLTASPVPEVHHISYWDDAKHCFNAGWIARRIAIRELDLDDNTARIYCRDYGDET